MKRTLTSLLIATALSGGAIAQTAPVGGADAKGNAPVKAVHTVNDGSAKPGANSFTENQAMKHIENTGYSGVSGLMQGRDGVWRGRAMKNGAPVNVAMDFKGNVTEGMMPAPSRRMARPGAVATPAETPSSAPPSDSAMAPAMDHQHHHGRHHHYRHHHHHHHHMSGAGVGMSGVDRNKNGISDKEDRAISHKQ